jgi:hypothetical protein
MILAEYVKSYKRVDTVADGKPDWSLAQFVNGRGENKTIYSRCGVVLLVSQLI